MSRIFEIFAGEYVRVTLSKGLRQTIEYKDTLKTIDGPREIEGFFLEECDDNFYMGDPEGNIIASINRKEYVTMEIADPTESRDEAFKEILANSDTKNGMN